MSIDRFTKQQFEASLPVNKHTGAPLWSWGGFQGEHFYYVNVSQNVRIKIWSSIGGSGLADGTGENSIRCFLVDINDQPLCKKLQAYVTRVSGWSVRLKDQLSKLFLLALKVSKPCPKCGAQVSIGTTKEGPNSGRQYFKCHSCKKFIGFVDGLPSAPKPATKDIKCVHNAVELDCDICWSNKFAAREIEQERRAFEYKMIEV